MCEEVFSVVNFKEDGKVELSEPFISKIKASPNPFIITFIGETRSGKSSRLNYILEGKIKLTKPFKTSGGFEACTEGISGYGPISFCDLDPIFSLFTDSRIIHLNNYLEDNNNENIQENIQEQIKEKIKDRNIFLIDCEGTGSIDKTTKGLNNALALLVQISSVITLVSKNPSDSLCQYFENVMQFSKELHIEDSKLNKAAALILRDIVSEVDPDYFARTNEENLSEFHYYENLRKDQECQFREKFFDKMNSQGTNFNPSMLKLLIQSDWILTENFHESMRDFIFFVLEIALRVASIDSEALLNIANFTLTILNDQCFDDLLPYDVMLTKYFLNKIQDSIVSSKITDIQNEMMKKPYKDLISLIPTQFYENALEFILNKFDEQVQEQHPNYKENFPTIFHEIRSYSSIKIKEGDIFEFLKMRGDSSGFIDDATNYYVSVVNQISHQLDEHMMNIILTNLIFKNS